MIATLLVALGAAVGAPLRFWLGDVFDRHTVDHFTGLPWGTLAANVAGSLLLGACAGWSVSGDGSALVGTGFCGALTTYSSFAMQSRDLGVRRGTSYVALTVCLALAACALGFWVAA